MPDADPPSILRGITRSRAMRCVILRRKADALAVEVTFGDDTPLGLQVHRGERQRVIRRVLKQQHRAQSCTGIYLFDYSEASKAEQLVLTLRKEFSRIALMPISQRNVERILTITSSERVRWTKDRRLRQSGSSQIRRAGVIELPTYAPEQIEYLLLNHPVLAEWRSQDKKARE